VLDVFIEPSFIAMLGDKTHEIYVEDFLINLVDSLNEDCLVAIIHLDLSHQV
jgi:hypothetical protein